MRQTREFGWTEGAQWSPLWCHPATSSLGACVLFFVLLSCSSEIRPIATFSGHCEAVLSPPRQGQLVSEARYFAPEHIRQDFVHWYDSVGVSTIAEEYLGRADPNSEVVQELQRLQMIGAWHTGTHLHVANSLLYSEADGMPMEYTFAGWVTMFRWYLDLENDPEMSEQQKCMYGAMNAYFDDLTVHGPGQAEDVIPLAYYMKSQEPYDSLVADSSR